jgi:hypothetical protein
VDRAPIASSSIASVGYDEASRTLEIEFHNGRIYRFFDVPPQMAQALRAAPSIGAYFNKYLRNGGYAFTLVRDA